MKRTRLRFLAHSAWCVLLATTAYAASRPHYGGVLRVETHAAAADPDNPARPLVFENLTAFDQEGKPQAKLANTWQAQSNDRRWQFWLRRGIRFHDGTPLTATAVVTSFAAVCGAGASTPSTRTEACPWVSLRAVGDSLVFDFADPRPRFAAEVALPRYSVQRSRPDALNVGTGPFRWAETRGDVDVLQANDDYWGGRPFVDTIELFASRSPREQVMDFDLGRADVIEVGPEQIRRMTKVRLTASQPAELIAVTISAASAALQDPRLREAMALSIDRTSIHNVVLQKQGEVAGGLLPNWVSGYAFLLAPARDLTRAQQLVRQLRNMPVLTIAAAAEHDPVLQLIAERVALNARETGLPVQPANGGGGKPDLVVTRAALESLDPSVALTLMAARVAGQHDSAPDSPEKMYEMERALIAQAYVIPLVHVPRVYALSPRVRNWSMMPDGRWALADVWLSAGEAAK